MPTYNLLTAGWSCPLIETSVQALPNPQYAHAYMRGSPLSSLIKALVHVSVPAQHGFGCKKNRHLCKIEMESKGSYSGLGFGRISSSADDSQWLCNLFVGVTTLVTVIKKCQQERIKGVCTTISTGIWNAHARWAYNASHVHRVVQCVSCKGLDDFHTRPRRHSVENLVSRNGDVCAIKRIRRRSSLKTNTKSQNIYVY